MSGKIKTAFSNFKVIAEADLGTCRDIQSALKGLTYY